MTDIYVGDCETEFHKFVAALHRRLGDKIMTSWMSDLRLEKKTSDSVTLSTESQLKCDTIGQRFVLLMREAWCEEVGPIRRLLIVTRERLSAGAARIAALKPAGFLNGRAGERKMKDDTAHVDFRLAKKQRQSGDEQRGPGLEELLLPIDERLTFERFAVDDSNRMAYAAAQQALIKEATSDLTYLYGASGVGKSHLLMAIGNEHRRLSGEAGCAYLTYNAMQSGCVNAVFSNGILALHRDLLAQDIVLIDDIHHLVSSPRTQTEILNLVNASLASGRRLVIAGEISPAKLAEAGMNARLCDRLAGGMSVLIRPGDASLRARVLRLRIQSATVQCRFDEGAIAYIAENFPNSLREAIGALNQLILAFGGQDVAIGRAEAAAALSTRLSEFRRSPGLEEAMNASAAAFGISVDELKGRGQPQRLARARHAFAIVGREILRESFPRIAKAIDRDHTTIMAGYHRGHALLERDKAFQAAIATIRESLGAPAH